MSIADQLTVMILTFDEEDNIARTLQALRWAKSILIIDSGSTDRTLDIVRGIEQCRVVHHAFDTFAGQCNFGLQQITTDWVLSLDADYQLSPELIEELGALEPRADDSGFRAGFVYCMYGRPLRASLYPPRCVLYRRSRANYRDEGHGHRVAIDGQVRELSGKIRHDDRKPLSRWLASQQRYARAEADHLLSAPASALGRIDKLRKWGWIAPLLVFVYTLLIKRCLLDGWPGWLYVLQRTLAETMLAVEIVDRKVRRGLRAQGGSG